MAKKTKVSEKTKEEAMKIARGTQRPAQTKEQTKLIAQGIQKGIELYKKQQKEKHRELDKKLKKANACVSSEKNSEDEPVENVKKNSMLPWLLLLLSWLGFAVYIFLAV